MIYSEQVNTLAVITKTHDFIEFSLNFDETFYDQYADQFEYDLDQNIKRRFLREIDSSVQNATVKHIEKNELLCCQKVNLFSIAAMMGKSNALKSASTRFDMWMGLDGQTLIQVCNKQNDTDSIQICLQKMATGNGSLNL